MRQTHLFIGIIGMLFATFIFAPQVHSADSFTLTTEVVEGKNVWLPATLTVHKGSDVTITLTNLSPKEHGFAVDELGVKEILPIGTTKTITLKPTASGAVKYYCPLHPSHIGGQLLVQ